MTERIEGGPFNVWQWVEQHKQKLSPPVGNALMYNKGELKVQFVAGPNQRSDFHVEDHEEFFYQLKGDMNLRIRDEKNNCFKDIPIKEGEMFVLPGNIPHSPQRKADTLGLVIEMERGKEELDHLRWYCEKCEEIVHDASFHCVDLGSQLKGAIEEYYATESMRTCKKCGHVNSVPK